MICLNGSLPLPRIDITSLYGPGVVAGWLLAFISVGLSWTLNPSLRRKDVITASLIFTLFYPLLAIYHAIQEADLSLAGAQGQNGGETFQASAILVSSVSIYELFALLAPILLIVSESRDHVGRSSVVFFVAVMGFLIKASLFLFFPQVPFNTLRPGIFSQLWAVVGIVMAARMFWHSRTRAPTRKLCTSDGEELNEQSVHSKTAHIVVFYIAYAGLGSWGLWEYDRTWYPTWSSLLFVTGTGPMTSFSQVLALAAGVMTLSLTVLGAFCEQKLERSISLGRCRDIESSCGLVGECESKEKTSW